MAVVRLKFLGRDEEELVHEQSLKSLSNLGVKVKSDRVLKMLEDAGAIVDRDRSVAKIPEDMVNDAVKNAPKSMVLGARNPKHDKKVPVETHSLLTTTGLAVYTVDLETGEKRPSTDADLADFAKLADALEGVDVSWTTVTAGDVNQDALAIRSLWTSLKNCGKHIQVVPAARDGRDARKQAELAALVAGGEDELRKRPLFSVISCPVAPLSFDRGPVDAQVEFARAGIPLVAMSMSLSGMSAPVTMGGTLVNINTENLASLTISQTAAAGAPFIYSSESAPIDMKTGVMDYGSLMFPLICAGAEQMAKRYGLPTMTASWGFETKNPGMPFGDVYHTAVSPLCGSDMISGAGSIDSAKGASLEQMMVDSYIWEDVRAVMRRYDVTEETAALNVVGEVGHGNTFLRHIHTVRNFKKELIFRDAEKRKLQISMSDDTTPRAREAVQRILKEHKVPPIDADTLRKGDELIAAYEKELRT
ncbi:MAG: trimethylamine methyltransferase family protein [Methanobacteriota archaeon]|nr:MAG: trimethylamine methyltransferase family protein [Euryarchaeota archaeon]